MSVAKFSQAGDASQPSPSIWRDCRMGLLNDLGLGRYLSYHGQAVSVGTSASGDERSMIGDFIQKCDDDVVLSDIIPSAVEGGKVDFQMATTDQDEIYIVAPVGQGLVLNSGFKVWFECRVHAGATGEDLAFVMGLQEAAGDGLARSGANAIQDNGLLLATESFMGFFNQSGDLTEIDAISQLDSTVTVVLNDVSRSTPFTDAGGTAADWPIADVYHKFGLRFDGIDKLYYYFDGTEVAALTLVAGTHPHGVAVGPIVGVKNGSGGVKSFNMTFMKYAEQVRT